MKQTFPPRLFPLFLVVLGALIILLLFSWLSDPVPVAANVGDLGRFTTRYTAAVGTRLETCATCHTSSPPSLNPYGSAYLSNGRSAAALAAIESADSDGDGWTNLQEIQALTFPGNPADMPVAVPTATNTVAPTVGATNTSVPAPTATNTPARSGPPPQV